MKRNVLFRVVLVLAVVALAQVLMESHANACIGKLRSRLKCCKPACCQTECCQTECCQPKCEPTCCETKCCEPTCCETKCCKKTRCRKHRGRKNCCATPCCGGEAAPTEEAAPAAPEAPTT